MIIRPIIVCSVLRSAPQKGRQVDLPGAISLGRQSFEKAANNFGNAYFYMFSLDKHTSKKKHNRFTRNVQQRKFQNSSIYSLSHSVGVGLMPKHHIWVYCVSLWVPEGQKTVQWKEYLSISLRPASHLCVAQPCLKRGRESTLNSHYSVTILNKYFFFLLWMSECLPRGSFQSPELYGVEVDGCPIQILPQILAWDVWVKKLWHYRWWIQKFHQHKYFWVNILYAKEILNNKMKLFSKKVWTFLCVLRIQGVC